MIKRYAIESKTVHHIVEYIKDDNKSKETRKLKASCEDMLTAIELQVHFQSQDIKPCNCIKREED